MRRLWQFAFCLALLPAVYAHAGEVIDRIIATVNRGVVLQSDLELALKCEALQQNRPLTALSQKDAELALNRLVDQQLLLQEIGEKEVPAQTNAEVEQRIQELRKQFPQAGSTEGWRAILRSYGLREEDVVERLRVQMQVLRFVDLRLRPNVRIEDADIATYYREEFLPKLKQAGGTEVPLADVRRRIRQILVERRVDELLEAWLHNLREQSTIHFDTDVLTPNRNGQIPVVVGGGETTASDE